MIILKAERPMEYWNINISVLTFDLKFWDFSMNLEFENLSFWMYKIEITRIIYVIKDQYYERFVL